MNGHTSDEERAVWNDLSRDLERAYNIVSTAHYRAITELDHYCSKEARNRIGHAKEVLSGLSYLFKPKGEGLPALSDNNHHHHHHQESA